MLTFTLYAIGLAFAVVAIIAAVAIYTRRIEDRERKRANKETQDHAVRLTNRALIVEAELKAERSAFELLKSEYEGRLKELRENPIRIYGVASGPAPKDPVYGDSPIKVSYGAWSKFKMLGVNLSDHRFLPSVPHQDLGHGRPGFHWSLPESGPIIDKRRFDASGPHFVCKGDVVSVGGLRAGDPVSVNGAMIGNIKHYGGASGTVTLTLGDKVEEVKLPCAGVPKPLKIVHGLKIRGADSQLDVGRAIFVGESGPSTLETFTADRSIFGHIIARSSDGLFSVEAIDEDAKKCLESWIVNGNSNAS